MFYISLKTNYKLTLKQVKMINEITNELCQLFFEKNNCMIHMEDDQMMYVNGKEIKCMIIHIFVDDVIVDEKYKHTLTNMICQITHIKYENIHILYHQKQ